MYKIEAKIGNWGQQYFKQIFCPSAQEILPTLVRVVYILSMIFNLHSFYIEFSSTGKENWKQGRKMHKRAQRGLWFLAS